MTLSLPRKFGLIGISVGLAVALSFWFIKIFNPFHLPNLNPAPPHNYQEPLLLSIIEYSYFVLCPGTLLQVFTLEMRGWFSWFMWIFAVLLNAPIYYSVGLVVEASLRRGNRAPAS